MKKLVLILVSFILIISFIIGGTIGVVFKFKARAHSEEKFTLPKVSLRDLEGNKIKLYKINKPTILLFWLPQSKSCQQQLETLGMIKAEYDDSLNIIAINIGQLDKNKMEEIDIELKKDIPMLIDNKAELTEKLKVTTIPTIIFYDPYKKPQSVVGIKGEKELEKLIKKHLTTLTTK